MTSRPAHPSPPPALRTSRSQLSLDTASWASVAETGSEGDWLELCSPVVRSRVAPTSARPTAGPVEPPLASPLDWSPTELTGSDLQSLLRPSLLSHILETSAPSEAPPRSRSELALNACSTSPPGAASVAWTTTARSVAGDRPARRRGPSPFPRDPEATVALLRRYLAENRRATLVRPALAASYRPTTPRATGPRTATELPTAAPPAPEDVLASAFAGMAAADAFDPDTAVNGTAYSYYDPAALDAWDSIEFRGILAGLWGSVRRRVQTGLFSEFPPDAAP
ncbi:hypothetical protein IWQ60_006207 [Tieghemiomyces parasiticus]|uniref:Uncharacterized protein n=1 Tax=Tieghemiomyces parasiticus TaxID=78921 RepID=A0A9W8A4X1_9FUNG|nr:hypothetical protein IWQ60_006207 [Tieghemiomyces parasiticus]